MSRSRTDVLVIGAGVSGLTTAVCLAEAKLSVRVRTRKPPLETTSAAAGAIWGPLLVDHARVVEWSRSTYEVLTELARHDGEKATGVRLVRGTEAARTLVEPPSWAAEITGFRRCDPAELPAGFVSGWRYTAPIVDMPTYLEYLAGRLERAGGEIEIGDAISLDEVSAEASPVTVNCAGMGARELVPDPDLQPVRGQLVIVDNPGIDHFFAEFWIACADAPPELTYYLPQGDHVVLGGSAEPDRADLEPDPKTTAAILDRCAAIEPALRDARVIGERIGIRPNRPQVRVESVDRNGRCLIHNYGHGGAGVSLSWGCALEVLRMVNSRW